MTNKLRSEVTVLLHIAAWLAFFWGPFHYALRTRFYFEGITVFDVIIFVVCLIAPTILLVLFRDRPAISFIAGTFCIAIFAYVSLFIIPTMDFPNTTTLITLAPGIQTQVGHVPMSLLIGSAVLGMGGFLQIHAYKLTASPVGETASFRGRMIDVLPFSVAPILYWLSMFIFPQNSNVSLVIICAASAFMIIIEAFHFNSLVGGWSFPDIATINTRSLPGMKIQALRAMLLWLAWGVFSVVMFLSVVMYFVINVNFPRYMLIGAFFLNCAIGAGIVALLSVVIGRVPIIQHFLPMAACLILLWQYESWIQTSSLPLVNPATGTVVAIFTWAFFQLFTRYSRGNATGVRGAGNLGLMLAWLVVAYSAFIPMHTSEITSLQPFMVPLLLAAGCIILGCGLLFHFFISRAERPVMPIQPREGGPLNAAP
nr:hypothetical protein [Candidatus Sigynarchaeota archaeon]